MCRCRRRWIADSYSLGNGRNRFDAIEQAKKNAVRDVIFKGITDGKNECNNRPVLVKLMQDRNMKIISMLFLRMKESI